MKRKLINLSCTLFLGIVLTFLLPEKVWADCSLLSEWVGCCTSEYGCFTCSCTEMGGGMQVCRDARLKDYNGPSCPIRVDVRDWYCTLGSSPCGGGGGGVGSKYGKVCSSTTPDSDPDCVGSSFSPEVPSGINIDYWGVSTGDDPNTWWITEENNTDVGGRISYTPGTNYTIGPSKRGKYGIRIVLDGVSGWTPVKCKTWYKDGQLFTSEGTDVCYFYVGYSGDDSGNYFAITPTTAPTCTISGPNSLTAGGATGYFTATATGHGDTVRRVEIWRAQTNDWDPTTGWRLVGNAVANPSGVSSTTQPWTAGMSDLTGYNGNKWWVVCNAYYSTDGSGTSSTRCTGNPWGVPADWGDCGLGDAMQVQVNPAPTPTPTPTSTPTPTPTNSPPAAPILSSPANGAICQNTSLTLSWNGVSSWGTCRPTQNNQYKVYLEAGDSTPDVVVTTLSSSSTSWVAAGLTPGVTYYWKVEANNGCLGTSSSTWSFTTKPNPPPNPTCSSCTCNVASAPEAATDCTVDWSDVSGAASYAVRVDSSPDSWSGNCNDPYPPNAGDFCVNGLSSSSFSFTGYGGYTYKTWFHARDSCGQWSPAGYCPNFTAPACPAKPSGLTATRNGCNVVLSWTDNSTNEEGFVIQRKLDLGDFLDWKTVGAGVTGITDSNVFCGSSPAVTATYRVSAINNTLDCPRNYSKEASASCPLTISNFNISDHSVVITMGEGPEPAFSYQVTFECGAFNRIEFTGYDSSLITVDPVSSNNQQGIVNITASSSKAGTTTITATAYLNPGGVKAGTDTVTVTVEPPPAWWQTKDGDVHGNGSITSLIPAIATADKYLSLKGDGGSPGVVSYGGSLELDAGSISETNWQAETVYKGDKITYDYLKNRLKVNTSSDTFNGTMPQETGTYFASSTKTLTGSFPSGKKIVIFVNGDATVKNDVVVPPGSFFALIAKGNLTFESSVTKAQGFYLADGTLKVASGNQLFAGEGSFIGWSEVILQRDLGGSSSLNLTPSEFFTFRPDLLINAPKEFLFKPFVFQEVAP